MEKKLPKFKIANKTGITSSEFLSSILSEFSIVIPIPTEKDMGIDMRCELLKEEMPTGLHYNIQCKGTDKVDEEKNYYSIQIKVSTINYWLQQKEPTFLIVVDRENNSAYWEYPTNILKYRLSDIQKQEHVSIKVHKKNIFKKGAKFLPMALLNSIYQYHYDLLEKAVGVLELELNERITSSTNISGLQKYLSISSSIEDLLSSISILENLNGNLVKKIKEIVEGELKHCWEALVSLDHIAEIRRYIKESILDEFGFMKDKTPQMVMDNLNNCWQRYIENGYKSSDLKSLDNALKDLLEMNRQLTFFLYEISYESNPWGDHEYILDKYRKK